MTGRLILWRLKQFKGWFLNNPGAKAAVLVGFLVVVLTVMAGLYLMTWGYFNFLALNEAVGQAVATYVINAAVLVLLLMGIFSAAVSNYRDLFKNREEHWLSLPLSGSQIFTAKGILTVSQSTWVWLVVFLPMALAYQRAFSPEGFLIKLLITLFGLLWLSYVAGAALAFLAVKLSRVNFRALTPVILLTAAVSVIGLVKFLFPKELVRVYQTETLEQFFSSMQGLPLLSTKLPSYWFAAFLTGEGLRFLPSLFLLILAAAVLWAFLSKLYPKYLNISGIKDTRPGKLEHFPKTGHYLEAVVLNQWWWLKKSPAEKLYGYFLLLLGLLILTIVSQVPVEQAAEQGRLEFVRLATFAGIAYLSVVAATRFVFPLLIKEKVGGWMAMSAPVDRGRLLDGLFIFALLLMVPFVVLALVTWSFLQLPLGLLFVYLVVFKVAVVLAAVAQFSLGVSVPSEDRTLNSETVSTTWPGLMALMLSLLNVTAAVYLLQQYPDGAWLNGLLGLVLLVVAHGLLLHRAYRLFEERDF